MKVSVSVTIKSDLNKIWASWITPEDIKCWNTASEDWHTTNCTIDFQVGGKFLFRMEAINGSMGFDFSGTYTKILEKELIEYSMEDGREVSVSFLKEDDGVKIIETFDAENDNPVDLQMIGWQNILDHFAEYVVSKV